ncbi:hypothetical protein D3C78_1724080 [compost metagenome]
MHSNAVQNEDAAALSGELLDGLQGRLGVARVDDGIRPQLAGMGELGLVHVSRDDPGGRHGAQELDGHVPEAADAQDQGGRAGGQQVKRALDGMVRGEGGIREGRGFARIELAEAYQQAW